MKTTSLLTLYNVKPLINFGFKLRKTAETKEELKALKGFNLLWRVSWLCALIIVVATFIFSSIFFISNDKISESTSQDSQVVGRVSEDYLEYRVTGKEDPVYVYFEDENEYLSEYKWRKVLVELDENGDFVGVTEYDENNDNEKIADEERQSEVIDMIKYESIVVAFVILMAVMINKNKYVVYFRNYYERYLNGELDNSQDTILTSKEV